MYFCWKLWCIFLNCIFCLEISIPSVSAKVQCFIWSSYSFVVFYHSLFPIFPSLFTLYPLLMCIHMHLGFLFLNFFCVQKYLKYELIFPKSNSFYINAYCSPPSYSSAIFCAKDCDFLEFGINWSVVQEQVLIIVSE